MEHDFVLAADEFHHKTKFPNEMWQTDFTYFKVKGWGWYYLSTVIDDYSRYIIHWELCSSMDEWVIIMKKDFMNHWIISHPKTYI